jgi:hypothetical protein
MPDQRTTHLLAAPLSLLLAAGCAAADTGSDRDEDFARFLVTDAGIERSLAFEDGEGLVMCTRDAGWADLWVRFAADTAAGGGVPRFDMDLCGVDAGGEFTPHDRTGLNCDAGTRWIAWWHDDGATFVSPPDAAPCTLAATLDGERLSGTFSCRGLTEVERRVDVEDGSFRCTVR